MLSLAKPKTKGRSQGPLQIKERLTIQKHFVANSRECFRKIKKVGQYRKDQDREVQLRLVAFHSQRDK